LTLSADGLRLAYPAGAGEVIVRATASGARLASVWIGGDATGAARARLSPDGGRLVTSSGQRFRVWSLPSASEPRPSTERAADLDVTALGVDAAADAVALGSGDGEIRIGDAADLGRAVAPSAELGYFAHRGAVRALALNTALGVVASGGEDGVVRLADLETGVPRDVAFARSAESGEAPIVAVALSPDGRFVAGVTRSSIRIWSAADGTVALDIALAAHGALTSFAFAPGGDYVAAGTADGTVQIWRRGGQARGAARRLPSAVRWLGFGSDGVLLAATDRWLHTFAVGPAGLEPLHSRPAPGSAAGARAFAAAGEERVRVLGFDARGVLRRADVDLAAPGTASVPPEVLNRDWSAALGLRLDDAGEVVSGER
jgi:hypothetical protein